MGLVARVALVVVVVIVAWAGIAWYARTSVNVKARQLQIGMTLEQIETVLGCAPSEMFTNKENGVTRAIWQTDGNRKLSVLIDATGAYSASLRYKPRFDHEEETLLFGESQVKKR